MPDSVFVLIGSVLPGIIDGLDTAPPPVIMPPISVVWAIVCGWDEFVMLTAPERQFRVSFLVIGTASTVISDREKSWSPGPASRKSRVF